MTQPINSVHAYHLWCSLYDWRSLHSFPIDNNIPLYPILSMVCPVQRIVEDFLEGRIAGSAVPQTKHYTNVAVRTECHREYGYIHCEMWPINCVLLAIICFEGFEL